ncbi:MAG TPA: BON domain-containing protein [Rhodopila sp.]|jgi:osmotically-inducible protein OsmY
MRPDLQVGDEKRRPQTASATDPHLSEEVGAASFPGCFGSLAVGDVTRTASRAPAETVENVEIDAACVCSDAELALVALAAIRRSALIAPGKVRSTVRNGWLTLEGEVEEAVQKRAAEVAVRALNGIRGITNNIVIQSEVMAHRVAEKIDEMFVRSARLSASRISVAARDHQIVLSGFVRSGEERSEAETAAWSVSGVAEVVNRIRAIA